MPYGIICYWEDIVPATWSWSNTLENFRSDAAGGIEFFQFTYPIFPPSSLQRFIIRFWATSTYGVSGSGPQVFPVPADWTISCYGDDTAGFQRSYFNEGWQEGLVGFADADVGGWNTVGSAVGPYPLVRDVTARKAAPPGLGAELDLHVDITVNRNRTEWTAQSFNFDRVGWLDVSILSTQPGI